MASNPRGRQQHRISLEAGMAGVLALLVDERERHVKTDREASKTEVLLSNAGLSVEDIQAASGKNPAAIRKAIQRARAR